LVQTADKEPTKKSMQIVEESDFTINSDDQGSDKDDSAMSSKDMKADLKKAKEQNEK